MKHTLLLSILFTTLVAQAAPKTEHKAWTDPEFALREDADFAIQGEYRSADGSPAMGGQVVALGSGRFDVHLLDGGLPGAGWEPGKTHTLLKGERKDTAIQCADDSCKTTASIANAQLSITLADGMKHTLNRIKRNSPTLGAKAPEGSIVLFDGSNAEAWENGRTENGYLLSTGCTSKQRFGSYTLHVEFRT
ncbi:MAG: hypothetical protein NTV80_08040, partial [Verrucomicrobia bacterium]|nr:hypothetical protein [Verrucomicrobiota bacterium]